MELSNIKIEIPKLWEGDWEKSFEEADEIECKILEIEQSAADLLKDIKNNKANPFRIGWFIHWTNQFCILEGIRSSLPRNSFFTLSIIERSIFESSWQLFTIISPLLDKNKSQINFPEEILWSQIRDNMNAFLSYCIWNDIRSVKFKLNNKNLYKVWNPQPVKDLIKNDYSVKFYESLYGSLKIESDAELISGKKKQRDSLNKVLTELSTWQNHPQIKYWISVIVQKENLLERPIGFFELFDESKTSIKKSLDENLSFAYSIYQDSSSLLHNSSLIQLTNISDDCLFPKFYVTIEETEEQILSMIGDCRRNLLFLTILKNKLWNT
ncbi:MAG: hypothetical protein ACE5IW_13705 [bacterium]